MECVCVCVWVYIWNPLTWAHNGTCPIHITWDQKTVQVEAKPQSSTEDPCVSRATDGVQRKTADVQKEEERQGGSLRNEVRGSLSMSVCVCVLREDTWPVTRSCWSPAQCMCRAAPQGSVQCRDEIPVLLLQKHEEHSWVWAEHENWSSSNCPAVSHLPELTLHWLSGLKDSVVPTSLPRNPFPKTPLWSHCELSRSSCRESCKSKAHWWVTGFSLHSTHLANHRR